MKNDMQREAEIGPVQQIWIGGLFQWFGVIGSTFTLVSSLQDAVQLSDWAVRLAGSWSAIAKEAWLTLLKFPLPEIILSQVDALLFSLVFFQVMICFRSSSVQRIFLIRPLLLAGLGALVFCAIFARGWLVTIVSYAAESDKVMQRVVSEDDFNIFENLEFMGEHFGEIGSIGHSMSSIAHQYVAYSPEVSFTLLSFFVFVWILCAYGLAECLLALAGRSVNTAQLNRNVWCVNAGVFLVLIANYLTLHFV